MAIDPGQHVLSGRDLRKEFVVNGRPVQALQGVSFDIPRGVLAALVVRMAQARPP